jgi:hypothetical protein
MRSTDFRIYEEARKQPLQVGDRVWVRDLNRVGKVHRFTRMGVDVLITGGQVVTKGFAQLIRFPALEEETYERKS